MSQPTLILASSSTTRKQLMDRLRLPYQCLAPDVDESPQGESHADQLAQRLAYQKAHIIAQQHPQAIVIGSDQVAWLENKPAQFLGKPITVANAIAQLQQLSGKQVNFSTALSVQWLDKGISETIIQHYQVKFRNLTFDEIQRYILLDDPLHCAGSFKCESLGISLFEYMHGDDITTLMGLPLISLCSILRSLNFQLP